MTEAIDLVNLPGTYSLSPRSLDEMISANVLLERQAELTPWTGTIRNFSVLIAAASSG